MREHNDGYLLLWSSKEQRRNDLEAEESQQFSSHVNELKDFYLRAVKHELSLVSLKEIEFVCKEVQKKDD